MFCKKVSAFIKNAQVLEQICAFFYLLFHKSNVLLWSGINIYMLGGFCFGKNNQ